MYFSDEVFKHDTPIIATDRACAGKVADWKAAGEQLSASCTWVRASGSLSLFGRGKEVCGRVIGRVLYQPQAIQLTLD